MHSQTDPNGNTTIMSYDADRRLLSTTAPAPFDGGTALTQATNTYDPDGNVIAITRTNGTTNVVTTKNYSATGQVQSVTDPNGNLTTNNYDADDRLVSVIDPLFRTTSYTYDAMSRLLTATNLAIQSTPLQQLAYTPDGLRASLTDANNHTTSYAYDGFDRLSTATYPNSSTETATYDADGNVLTRVTRKGDTISFAYDTLNRLSAEIPPSPEAVVSYAYDPAGRLVSVSDNSAAMTSAAAAGGTTVQYSTIMAYDQLNRPVSASWNPAPAQTTPTASGSLFAYGYDATNRRISQAANDNSWWSYPGSAASVSYTANNLNQYTAVGSTSPTYDGNGNLAYDGSYTYCYDGEGRLIGIVTGTCASPTTTIATYAYDAQGRRKSKTVGSATTIYVADADGRAVIEYNGASGSGAIQAWYAYGGAALNRMNVAAGTRQTMIPDIQGSIVATLNSSGTSLTKTGYQPYGEHPGLASGSYQYTAQRFDSETAGSGAEPSGLYYYGARMYSPALGRFLQPDPVGYQAGANLYAYVGNDPLNLTDPTGLCFLGCFWKSPIFRVVAAIVAAVAVQEALPEIETAAFANSSAGILTNAAAAGAAGGAVQGGTLRSTAAGALADVTATALAGPLGNIAGPTAGDIGAGAIGGAVGGAIQGGTFRSALTGAVVGGAVAGAVDLGEDVIQQYEGIIVTCNDAGCFDQFGNAVNDNQVAGLRSCISKFIQACGVVLGIATGQGAIGVKPPPVPITPPPIIEEAPIKRPDIE